MWLVQFFTNKYGKGEVDKGSDLLEVVFYQMPERGLELWIPDQNPNQSNQTK